MVRMIVFGFVFIAGLKFGVGFWFELMKQAGGPCEPSARMLPRPMLLVFLVLVSLFCLVGVESVPRGSLLTGYRRFNYFCFSSYVLWSGQGNVDFPDQAEGLVATRHGLRHFVRIQRSDWVRRILKIRHQVGRGAAGEALDAWILHDRLVEIDEHRIDQR